LDKVSKFCPKRKSEAVSMVNLAKRSWTLQGSSREARFDNKVIVRPACFSNNSKSDVRLRVKKGRASERCYNETYQPSTTVSGGQIVVHISISA
jgi:hypothetical protein